jgi:hypothetical protein
MVESQQVRVGDMSVLLPSSTPEHKVRPLVRRRVINALAATGEWPTRIRVVTGQRLNDGSMKRWFVKYQTGPHGLMLDPPDAFD